MIQLSATTRDSGKKLGILRASGHIPAVVYGRGLSTKTFALPKKEFAKAFKEAGESSLLELSFGEKEKKQTVLIRDVQLHPVSDEILHADFYAVRMDEKIKVTVPLVFQHDAPAAERGEGVLVKNIHEVELEALPASLPHELRIDLSVLNAVDDAIRLKDIECTKEVKIMGEPEEIVAIIAPAMSEEELAALETPPEEKMEEVGVAGEEKEKAEEPEGEQEREGAGAKTKEASSEEQNKK